MSEITKHEFLSAVGRLAESVYDFHHRFGSIPADSNGSPDRALDVRSDTTIATARETFKIADPEMAERFLEGLRKAGLPEE